MGVINLGILVSKIKGKLIESGFVRNTDYATASKGGVVKVGTTGGLQVSSGTLKGKTLADAAAYASANDDTVMTKGDMSYVSTGGIFSVTEIYSNPGSSSAAAEFTFPSGKTLSDYSFILICAFYDNTAGTPDECITSVLPVSLITAAGEEGIKTRINYDNTYYWNATVTTTGIGNPAGQYHTKKVYAF